MEKSILFFVGPFACLAELDQPEEKYAFFDLDEMKWCTGINGKVLGLKNIKKTVQRSLASHKARLGEDDPAKQLFDSFEISEKDDRLTLRNKWLHLDVWPNRKGTQEQRSAFYKFWEMDSYRKAIDERDPHGFWATTTLPTNLTGKPRRFSSKCGKSGAGAEGAVSSEW